MAGQGAGSVDAETGELLTGNEDVAVRALTLEVFGCRTHEATEEEAQHQGICGDGLVVSPEQCDTGSWTVTASSRELAEATAQAQLGTSRVPYVLGNSSEAGDGNVTLTLSANGAGTSCSLGCTAWQPSACAQFGTCAPVLQDEPRGQDMPGKNEVGSTELPAWITIADADFDAVFRAAEEAIAEGETCTNRAAATTLASCPGTLTKYWHPVAKKFICAPKLSSQLREGGAHSFFVSLPNNARVAGFRGRVVAMARGQMDAFLNTSTPHDFSSASCADATQCGAGFGGAMWDNARVRATGCPANEPSCVDGSYVDGVSLTVRQDGCTGRQHVWTYAVGTATGLPAGMLTTWRPDELDQFKYVHDMCGPLATNLEAICYVGSCECHGGEEARSASLGAQGVAAPTDFGVPSFVGTDVYCDGGTSDDPAYDYSNSWKTRAMFNSSEVCVSSNGRRGANWWASEGRKGPGWFVKGLPFLTNEPLEVRVMVGMDSFYENLGILRLELDACVCAEDTGEDSESADRCFQRCQGLLRSELELAQESAEEHEARADLLRNGLMAAGSIVVASVLATLAYVVIRLAVLRRKTRENRERWTQQQLDESIAMTKTLIFNSASVEALDFLGLGKLVMHEELRDRGLLRFLDTIDDILACKELMIFISHRMPQ
tara:strand:- start:2402 stop:4384 length:1983 start_codon:yes stop_codon:yes gene_type:complete